MTAPTSKPLPTREEKHSNKTRKLLFPRLRYKPIKMLELMYRHRTIFNL
jgi:hypothetical protein